MGPSARTIAFLRFKSPCVQAPPRKYPKSPKSAILGGPCGVSGGQQRRLAPICGVQCGLEHHSGWCAAWCARWARLRMRGCTSHVACPPLVQACDPPRTDGSEAPCTRMCHLAWPRRELMGPYAPHRRGFCGSKAARACRRRPKSPHTAQNLQFWAARAASPEATGAARRRSAACDAA